jgi:23S rRNA pseudouridine1911/1915/1917 synthase
LTGEVIATPGRLDVVLSELTGSPRAEIQRAIASGDVSVDGVLRSKSFRLSGGEAIAFTLRGELPLEPGGEEVPIRYRDDHLIVVAKPAGMITHPTPARREGTLVNSLLAMKIPLARSGGELRPGVVHRLDAGTSGLMVVACKDEAFEALRGMFRRHQVDRTYLALVRGEPLADSFGVDAPLGRRAARIVVDRSEGRAASTEVRVSERLGRASLVEASPRTGRTHQIRVHLSAVGHPILGDRSYGGMGELARELGLTRPFLHSAHLELRHPITGVTVSVSEPLPADLALALDRARNYQVS